MPDRVLVDNDIALKIACYGFSEEMVAATTVGGDAPRLLGVARYVVHKHLTRVTVIADREAAIAAFDHLLAAVAEVEPNDAELALAADLETEAMRRNLELDGGESQLIAILVSRDCDLLITGDKRAIVAMASVAPPEANGRVACLEQLAREIVGRMGADRARRKVCAEPLVDRALTACFACASEPAPSEKYIFAGLASYIDHLASEAPGVLARGNGLEVLGA